ncbi:hypothetical protein P3X46_032655 [Hevea brasiliensis]|uniref:Uncharacterized protein n=1 Tax=Hevea brasiliensis TaxID=3981 RepID=A0ABQ9KFH6_HEVBR|nr:uncharacterized protein At3g27210 [Hevea brasiliensis]KAJ9135474.1 hypothetical protein P3X46_032655 [Hevea brasiliensis]
MGSCVSVHKGTPESAMKLGVSFGSRTDNLGIPESPIKDKHVNGDTPIKTFEDYGSKDETFFDSQPWLESDCEDDFFSVNGEFTPSRGSTPVHHSFSTGTPKINKTPLEDGHPDSILEPSPTGNKKRLYELFQESLREEPEADDRQTSGKQNTANGKMEVKPTILDVLPKSASGTPYFSGTNSVCSSERTTNGDALIEREKSIKSMQCCLPSLISCSSFSERKKKMSPALAIAVNDKA